MSEPSPHSLNPPEPLRLAVERSVRHYLSTLEGSEIKTLYDIVLCEIEAGLIETVLKYTAYNQSRAAEILGLSRATLRKKMKSFQLVEPLTTESTENA